MKTLLLGALTIAAASATAIAQDTIPVIIVEHRPSAFEQRASGSIAFTQMRPSGEFQKNIGRFGYGGEGAGLFRLDGRGILSLRLDGGFLIYGQESKRVPLSPTIGGRILVDLSTNNNVAFAGIGPQLAVPTGPVRPYVHAGVGFNVFFTESSVNGSDDRFDFANTTNHSDGTGTWTAGGGVYVPVYMGKVPVMLDFGVSYMAGGRTSYLRPGSITDLPNGQIQITPLESETRFMIVRVGVKIGR